MIENIFNEIRLKQHDEDFEPRAEGLPTGAKAGSLEKLFVIADRVEKGERKSKFINKIFKQKLSERQHIRKAKHG
jgi:hypothetical protein